MTYDEIIFSVLSVFFLILLVVLYLKPKPFYLGHDENMFGENEIKRSVFMSLIFPLLMFLFQVYLLLNGSESVRFIFKISFFIAFTPFFILLIVQNTKAYKESFAIKLKENKIVINHYRGRMIVKMSRIKEVHFKEGVIVFRFGWSKIDLSLSKEEFERLLPLLKEKIPIAKFVVN